MFLGFNPTQLSANYYATAMKKYVEERNGRDNLRRCWYCSVSNVQSVPSTKSASQLQLSANETLYLLKPL
jgi:hypothetical protein